MLMKKSSPLPFGLPPRGKAPCGTVAPARVSHARDVQFPRIAEASPSAEVSAGHPQPHRAGARRPFSFLPVRLTVVKGASSDLPPWNCNTECESRVVQAATQVRKLQLHAACCEDLDLGQELTLQELSMRGQLFCLISFLKLIGTDSRR
ncbi:uncharacterized protein RDI95_007910 [Morus bassanus]